MKRDPRQLEFDFDGNEEKAQLAKEAMSKLTKIYSNHTNFYYTINTIAYSNITTTTAAITNLWNPNTSTTGNR